jgi:hypothetical protein
MLSILGTLALIGHYELLAGCAWVSLLPLATFSFKTLKRFSIWALGVAILLIVAFVALQRSMTLN